MRHFAVLLLMVLLLGCGKVGGLMDLIETAEAVETELANRYDLKCDVFVQKTNGRLKSVSVVLMSAAVRDRQVGELVALVEPVVERHFKEKPDVLVVSFAVEN